MAAIPNMTYSPGQPMQDFFDIVNQTIDALNAITNGNDIACKVITMGAWNMSSPTNKTFAHGLPDITKITSVTFAIRNDAQDSIRDLGSTAFLGAGQEEFQAAYRVDATNVEVAQFGGIFSGSNYNDGVINRGYITIFYKK